MRSKVPPYIPGFIPNPIPGGHAFPFNIPNIYNIPFPRPTTPGHVPNVPSGTGVPGGIGIPTRPKPPGGRKGGGGSGRHIMPTIRPPKSGRIRPQSI